MFSKVLVVALGGSCGAVVRWLLSEWVTRKADVAWPWGTLTVNLLGCMLFGLIVGLMEGRELASPTTRLLLLTGFMGSLTTFSTFAFESSAMLRDQQWVSLGANLLAQNAAGIALVIAGLLIGRQI